MASVRIDGDDLVIEQSAVDTVLSLRSSLRIPLANVRGVTADPGIAGEAKGLRAPGAHVPGLLTLGTFYREGRKTFWNIRRGANAIVITLEHTDFDQLVIEVDDPQQTIAEVNSARSR